MTGAGISLVELVPIGAKLLLYAATFGGAGTAIFLLLFAPQLTRQEQRRIANLSFGLAALAVGVSILRLCLLVVTLGGGVAGLSDSFVLQVVLEGPEGRSAAIRIAGLALLLLVLRRSRSTALAGAGAAAAAASFAFTGHTAAAGVIAQLLAGMHLLGIAYWLGAFVPLRMLSVGGDLPRIARVMKRFGDIALGAVALLIAAGIALLWLLLGSPLAVFDSAYGRLLFAKLLFVAGLLGLAALNKLRLTPRLLVGDGSALRALRMSITFELAIALVILTLTASFTTVTGPPALE